MVVMVIGVEVVEVAMIGECGYRCRNGGGGNDW